MTETVLPEPDSPGSPEAARALELAASLAAAQLTSCAAGEALDAAVMAERLKSWADALLMTSLSRLLAVAESDAAQLREQRARRLPPGGSRFDRRAAGDLSGWELALAEVAPALTWSGDQATSRLVTATGLQSLPAVLSLLRRGGIDLYRAQVIADLMHEAARHNVFEVGDEVWCTMERELVVRAPGLTAPELRRLLRRLLMKVDPELSAKRRKAAAADRSVRIWPEPDGMAMLSARLGATEAMKADTCLNAMADAARHHADRSGASDPRSHDQLRADALSEIFTSILETRPLEFVPMAAAVGDSGPEPELSPSDTSPGPVEPPLLESTAPVGALSPTEPPDDVWAFAPAGRVTHVPRWWDPPALPRRKGRRPHLVVTVRDTTLAGADEEPAELAGYGPIGADVARRIAATADTAQVVPLPREVAVKPKTVQRRLVQTRPVQTRPVQTRGESSRPELPTSECEEGCRKRPYTPDQDLVDLILACHPRCDAPGCSRRAERCDLDHVVPWSRGGTTCRHNLRPRCRRHHRLKTHAGWRTRPSGVPPGSVEWTTRLGRRYSVPPPDRPGSPGW